MRRSEPQRLKAAYLVGASLTAEAVPFPSRARTDLNQSFPSYDNDDKVVTTKEIKREPHGLRFFLAYDKSSGSFAVGATSVEQQELAGEELSEAAGGVGGNGVHA